MPQGRRKVPFSGKKKKEQIIAKRHIKVARSARKSYDDSDESDEMSASGDNIQKVNAQPFEKRKPDKNRFTLQFHKESKKELALMREEAQQPFKHVSPKEREIDAHYFDGYDFPTRPEWRYDMTKEELTRNESRYFTEYIQKLEQHHYGENKTLSVFELNLETWRQLWRVLELSDILLAIVDVRYSALMFPPSLYKFVTQDMNKKMILVLNKIDLVAPEVVLAWKHYFAATYPGMSVVCFASYPVFNKSKGLPKGRRRLNVKFASEGAYSIYKASKELIRDEVNITQWEQKILEDMAQSEDTQGDDSDSGNCTAISTHKENYEFDFEKREKYKDGILTIGCVGFPNVGKSSIINALKGRKVVSVSRTPGHTKHFQTIFLTKNVKLCDCPGLVFPSSVPKYIQVILGSYPIAQLREPYCSIKYVGERINLPEILGLELPSDFSEWSAMAVCEAWARKRGFLTAKASRPDIYRAANNILRMTLDGKITVEFYPSNFFENEEKWKTHPDLGEIKTVQGGRTRVSSAGEATNELPSGTESDDDSGTETDHSMDSEGVDDIPTHKRDENAFSLLKEDV